MEEDESTNQNPVKNKIFLWITGQFHFGTGKEGRFLSSILDKERAFLMHWLQSHKKSGAIAAPELCHFLLKRYWTVVY
jgi:hypothetical protein